MKKTGNKRARKLRLKRTLVCKLDCDALTRVNGASAMTICYCIESLGFCPSAAHPCS